MLGQAMPLSDFIEGKRMQLIIPVYQRNYDWKIDNCAQLLADLIKLKDSNRPSHFFGSIVSAPADSAGRNRLIIDGQQRLTTTSLLILAAIKAVKDGYMKVGDEGQLDDLMDIYLMAKSCQNTARKIKLVPIEKDQEAFDRLFGQDESKYIDNSKVTRNFKYFYDRFKAEPSLFTFDELSSAIDRLHIISIDLQENDDPQLIFESLNSTGLALSEADKIRNYLLMSLPGEEQEICYKNFWQKIEEATNGEPTMFLRDYITIVEQLKRPVKTNLLYFEWKRYMEGHDRKSEMENMLLYSKFYKQVTSGDIYTIVDGHEVKSDRLSKKMKQLCNLETDIMNSFLIRFLKYAQDYNLGEDDVWDTLNLIETYLARRIVCGIPSNALTQVFCALHKDVLHSIEEYSNANLPLNNTYSDILSYHILRRDGSYSIPRDTQFIPDIYTKDVYHMMKPYKVFLIERLENMNNKEFIDVAQEMADGDATIEHIMPQKLTPEWNRMLGDKATEIHEKYLHTLANLTLTGVNSELSNNPFNEKKNGTTINGVFVNGYISSKYRLTKDIIPFDKWTEEELQKRGKIIEKMLLSLYPMPQSSFKPLAKSNDEVYLDDGFTPTNRSIVGYTLFDKHYDETVWVSMYINVVKQLLDRYPDAMEQLVNKHYLWTKDNYNEKYCTKITDDLFLWVSMGNRSKVNGLRYIFETIDLSQSELLIEMEPQK
ncbi:MAG: DUF262 domain-containing HNH endonuclease family protein [Bacteroidales bacterium]|nr:DUF262 domain-containing HNH endonuclease family protein [Bacteroidales bacterium]